MGDRISIQFENNGDKSVVLFNHWGGMAFLNVANDYVKILKAERTGQIRPLDRFEPDTVMMDFIRFITCDMDRVTSSLYLGIDENDGDNSDNGHHIIQL